MTKDYPPFPALPGRESHAAGPSMIVLEAERLLFRDHGPEDLELFCAMEADPEVRRFVGGRPRARPLRSLD